MASDVEATIEFWQQCFGAVVVGDESMAGTRNVFLNVGGGRLNLYDQAPNRRGPVNHVGVHVRDLPATAARLEAGGWKPNPIKTDGPLSYVMVEGPDGLLLEVFHFDSDATPEHLRPYFDLATGGAGDTDAESETTGSGESIESVAGAGSLSPQAEARLAGPAQDPLRPPPPTDREALAAWRRSIHDRWLDGDPSAEACGHRPVTIGGVPCLRAEREGAPLMIYFHGGGYALGSPEVALPITERLAAGCDVVSVDYRLAPEHPFPAAVNDAVAVHEAMREIDSRRPVVLAGDSAGSSIALSLALDLVGRGEPPAALVLLSPHLDQRSSDRPAADPMSDVDKTAAAWLSEAYRGGRPADDPAVSPLLADHRGLPPTLVQAGTIDSSLTTAVRFARSARARGVPITLDIWDGLWHTWHYHRELPEAQAALDEALRFVAANAGVGGR